MDIQFAIMGTLKLASTLPFFTSIHVVCSQFRKHTYFQMSIPNRLITKLIPCMSTVVVITVNFHLLLALRKRFMFINNNTTELSGQVGPGT